MTEENYEIVEEFQDYMQEVVGVEVEIRPMEDCNGEGNEPPPPISAS